MLTDSISGDWLYLLSVGTQTLKSIASVIPEVKPTFGVFNNINQKIPSASTHFELGSVALAVEVPCRLTAIQISASRLSLYSGPEWPKENRKHTHKRVYSRVIKTKLFICSSIHSFHSHPPCARHYISC